MALAPISVVIRCSNQTTFAATPYKDVTIYGWSIKPRWKDEPDSEPTKDVGGYQGNGIARRREYEFIITDATVRESSDDQDFGAMDRLAHLLYCGHLWITQASGSPRVHRGIDTPESAVAFWSDGNGVDLPVEVRRVSFDYGDGANGTLSPVLVLEDVVPFVGVTFS